MTSRREILTAGLSLPLAFGLTPASARITSSAEQEFAHRIFQKLNDLRVARETPALIWSDVIAGCAREQSMRKAQLRFPGHDDPERGDVAARLNRAGIHWARCGENLFTENGWDDPVNFAVVFWWYSTSGHQQNLLTPEYTESAVGVVKAEDGTFFVTQIFVTPPSADPRRLTRR
jgi:uncharacterized protein YkwD